MSTSQSTLSPAQGQLLVQLARKTLIGHFSLSLPEDHVERLNEGLKDEAFQALSGVFVTLRMGGHLRGCMGTLQGREPLASAVATQAVNAAFHDPRFSALEKNELDRVNIEVSVLTRPQPLIYSDADDLVVKLRPHVDGVTISLDYAGATFLPQVWEQLPRPDDFLSHLCMKACLDRDAWREGKLHVETYQVQYFEEPL